MADYEYRASMKKKIEELCFLLENSGGEVKKNLVNRINDKVLDSQSNNNPLHIASQQNLLNSALVLLKNGAAYEWKNGEGKTPLDLADSKHTDVALLLKKIESCRDFCGKVGTRHNNINELMRRMSYQKIEEFEAIVFASNSKGITLLDYCVLLDNQHLANKLVKKMIARCSNEKLIKLPSSCILKPFLDYLNNRDDYLKQSLKSSVYVSGRPLVRGCFEEILAKAVAIIRLFPEENVYTYIISHALRIANAAQLESLAQPITSLPSQPKIGELWTTKYMVEPATDWNYALSCEKMRDLLSSTIILPVNLLIGSVQLHEIVKGNLLPIQISAIERLAKANMIPYLCLAAVEMGGPTTSPSTLDFLVANNSLEHKISREQSIRVLNILLEHRARCSKIIQELLSSDNQKEEISIMHLATRAGNVKAMELMFEATNGRVQNFKNMKGETLVFTSIASNQMGALCFLMKNNASLKIFASNGDSVIHKAVKLNHYSVLKYLLLVMKGIPVTQPPTSNLNDQTRSLLEEFIDRTDDLENMSPLQIACSRDNPAIYQLLCSYGATYDFVDSNGKAITTYIKEDQIYQLHQRLSNAFGYTSTNEGRSKLINMLQTSDRAMRVLLGGVRGCGGVAHGRSRRLFDVLMENGDVQMARFIQDCYTDALKNSVYR